jgi:hypothetical protein
MVIKEKHDKTITFHDWSGAPITDLYDSPDDETAEAAAGVDNDNVNHDDDIPDEAPVITIEQHHSDSEDDGTVNGDITGVTIEYGEVTGVTIEGSNVTGVTTEDGGTTGVKPHHGAKTTGVLLNDDEATSSGTEGHPGTP